MRDGVLDVVEGEYKVEDSIKEFYDALLLSLTQSKALNGCCEGVVTFHSLFGCGLKKYCALSFAFDLEELVCVDPPQD